MGRGSKGSAKRGNKWRLTNGRGRRGGETPAERWIVVLLAIICLIGWDGERSKRGINSVKKKWRATIKIKVIDDGKSLSRLRGRHEWETQVAFNNMPSHLRSKASVLTDERESLVAGAKGKCQNTKDRATVDGLKGMERDLNPPFHRVLCSLLQCLEGSPYSRRLLFINRRHHPLYLFFSGFLSRTRVEPVRRRSWVGKKKMKKGVRAIESKHGARHVLFFVALFTSPNSFGLLLRLSLFLSKSRNDSISLREYSRPWLWAGPMHWRQQQQQRRRRRNGRVGHNKWTAPASLLAMCTYYFLDFIKYMKLGCVRRHYLQRLAS